MEILEQSKSYCIVCVYIDSSDIYITSLKVDGCINSESLLHEWDKKNDLTRCDIKEGRFFFLIQEKWFLLGQ